MFKTAHIALGEVKPRQKSKMVFPYEGIHVTAMNASCGCSTPLNDPKNSQVTVEYEAGFIPPHMKEQGTKEYHTSKTIKIEYVPVEKPLTDDGKPNTHHQLLVFTATIIEE